MEKIYKWKCPKCGKEIVSIYEKQFDNNKQVHKMTHMEYVDN